MDYLQINSAGSRIAYLEYGDPKGHPILVQHGLIASIRDGDLFDPLTERGARLICIARPGYGESSPYRMRSMEEWGELIRLLADNLELEQFDVLGMSSGAPYSYAIGHALGGRARNIYIFSGIPAMFDEKVLTLWPYPVDKGAGFAETQKMAYGLFFSNLAPEDKARNDTQDAMANGAFGIGQDFYLRCRDWGFKLEDLKQKVFMRHARFDPGVPLSTAELTAGMIQNCELRIEENDIHFSTDALAAFFIATILPRLT